MFARWCRSMTLSINKVHNQAIANKSEGTKLVNGTGSAVLLTWWFHTFSIKRVATLFQTERLEKGRKSFLKNGQHFDLGVDVSVCAATIGWGMLRGTVKRPAKRAAMWSSRWGSKLELWTDAEGRAFERCFFQLIPSRFVLRTVWGSKPSLIKTCLGKNVSFDSLWSCAFADHNKMISEVKVVQNEGVWVV